MSSLPKRPSLADLAQHLGLAASTVSRALGNSPDISAATRAKVQAAALALHYRPNQLAAALRRGRSRTLGVVVPHLSGYFFPAVVTGIGRVASAAGYHVLVCQSDEDMRRERQNLESLVGAQVEGILLALSATTHHEVAHLEQVRQQGTPLVCFDRVPDWPGSPAVVLDDFGGAYQAVSHLLAQGCRRIAHLAGPPHLSPSRHCYQGYRAALHDHGLPLHAPWVHPLPTPDRAAGYQAMLHLLSLDVVPDAVFAAAALPAVGALEAALAQGLRVPQDLALACVGNDPFTTMTQPPLTAVDQCAEPLGEAAGQLLLQLLRPGAEISPTPLVLRPVLHVRPSSLHPTPEPCLRPAAAPLIFAPRFFA